MAAIPGLLYPTRSGRELVHGRRLQRRSLRKGCGGGAADKAAEAESRRMVRLTFKSLRSGCRIRSWRTLEGSDDHPVIPIFM